MRTELTLFFEFKEFGTENCRQITWHERNKFNAGQSMKIETIQLSDKKDTPYLLINCKSLQKKLFSEQEITKLFGSYAVVITDYLLKKNSNKS